MVLATNLREYEAMVIVKSDLPETELTKMVQRWEGIMCEDGGQIVKKENWGVKRLAYPIQKSSRGNYFVYDFASSAKSVREFERVVKVDENVIRSLVIKLNDKIDVNERKLELQRQAEAAAQNAAEAARDRADSESMSARRGPRDEEA